MDARFVSQLAEDPNAHRYSSNGSSSNACNEVPLALSV